MYVRKVHVELFGDDKGTRVPVVQTADSWMVLQVLEFIGLYSALGFWVSWVFIGLKNTLNPEPSRPQMKQKSWQPPP